MIEEKEFWSCSVCGEEIPKGKIFIELKTDSLICEDCLQKRKETQKREQEG